MGKNVILPDIIAVKVLGFTRNIQPNLLLWEGRDIGEGEVIEVIQG